MNSPQQQKSTIDHHLAGAVQPQLVIAASENIFPCLARRCSRGQAAFPFSTTPAPAGCCQRYGNGLMNVVRVASGYHGGPPDSFCSGVT